MRVEAENLVELWETSRARYADRPALGTKRSGEWVWTTYQALGREIDRVRGGLAGVGVGKGDVVAIVSGNRVEWAAACYATYGLEAAFVPLYEQQRPEEWRFILGDCEAKVVIVGSSSAFERISAMQSELPALRHVVGIELPPADPRSFDALARAGEEVPSPPARPDPDATAGLIYTSGTTGNPKGVILSHRNFASNVSAMSEAFPLEPDDRTLSFLPWAHAFGQVAELHYGLSQGASLALNDELPHLLDNLLEVRPTVLVAVPRIFQRIHGLVQERIAARPAFVQRLFAGGIRSAAKRERGETLRWTERAELRIDDLLIFRNVRKRFGGRLRFVISASAALSPDVAHLVDAVGLPVYEGYGLTETSPAVTVNTPGHRKIGSVGRVLPGVRIEIDESKGEQPGHGEVIVYGPNVMKGYHERPEENAAVFTPDGGLRTGDLGWVDEEGFLYISGRVKELFKLENGKYVSPAPLEEALKLSPYVANVVLYGANRPFVTAIVAPDAEAIRRWAESENVELGPLDQDPRVRELITQEIARRSETFPSYEVPRKVLIAPADFTLEDDLITPTLKVKRRKVEARFAKALDALYREAPPERARPQPRA